MGGALDTGTVCTQLLVLSLSTVGFAGQAEFFASTRKEESCTYRT